MSDSGAMLWSGTTPEGDLPLWLRIIALPFYLADHAYHCLRGTPVYIQYGDHHLRRTDSAENREEN